MDFPLITDPYFYAVAVPAVLLLGISKSGFGAGFGSLAVPLMALAISVPQAAAILMPLLLLMDLLGIAAFRKDFDYPFLKFLVPFGLVGTVVGALLFRVLDAHTVAAIVGGFTLLFLAQRLLFPPRPDSPPPPKWLGALLTITSGFTSFVAHAGGPPISAYVIPLRLSPVQVDSLRLAGPAWLAQHGDLAGAAAAGADWRMGGRAHGPHDQPGLVLPGYLWRHVPDRRQAAVGRVGLIAID